ncbi:21248_t:CDS:2 [Cetraspora pellucida]|uniref:21248_t:CDS:1 n=1 Tax=Cetraspora pellucida TaxID=1433469 RepID=A0A9N8Z2H8_9GLOM|nr:21248_t:CDS:2 [Cetraspora pellucida]
MEDNKGLDDIEYDDESVDEYLDKYLNGEGEGSGGHTIKLADPEKTTPLHYVEEAKQALADLKAIIKEPGWKGVTSKYTRVYSKLGSLRNEKLPVFMGQCEIRGFSPMPIFTVIGRRKLWDDWFEEGSIIESLDDTTSLTYMVMQGISGSRARDLSLVEKVEWSPNGTIYFASTSVNTAKVPQVPGKIRSTLSLSGWILEPTSSNPPSTKVTYILQLHVKGWIPSLVAKKYLAKRPLIINKINSYLQKHGAPDISLPPTPTGSKHTTLLIDRNELYNNKALKALASIDNEQDKPKDNYEEEDSELMPKIPDQSPILPSSSEHEPSVHQPTSSSENHSNLPQESKPELKELIIEKVNSYPHQDNALEALKILKSLVKDQTSWELYSENKGIKIYQRENPGKSIPCMRGDVTIYGDFLPEDIRTYATSLDARKLWDDRYEEGTTIERYSLTDVLTRTAMKGTFPISGRDFSMISTVDRDPDGTIWCATTSIVDPKIPENKKYVRAELSLAGWELRPVYDSVGNRIAIDVKYIVDTDIKLESVPTRILKSISMQTPMCVAKIDELLKKIGFPPYIRHTTGTIIEEEFNTKDFQYDLTLSNTEEERITELRTSNKMYPNGFNISTKPENVKVELNSDDSGVVCIIVPVDINAEKLQITIVKNTSKDVQITCNGNQILSMKSKDENKDNELSRSIKENSDVTPMQTEITQNSNFSKGQDQQISKVDVQSDIAREVSQANIQPDTSKNNIDINRNISKNGDNVVVPKESSKMYKQRSDLIVFSEQIRFDYKQLGLMFASMLLAYQAGKFSGC